jgi:hypothetical protein
MVSVSQIFIAVMAFNSGATAAVSEEVSFLVSQE